MKILSFISVTYLLAMPCWGQGATLLPRPTQVPIGLSQFLRTAQSGNFSFMFMAEKLREFIDFNREKEAWEASSIALTVRRMRGIYPADRYAELLDVSPEELQSFENGTTIPNGVVLDKVVKSMANETILEYFKSRGADIKKRLEILFSNGVDRLVETIKNTTTTEVFLASFNQALQDAEAGSTKAAQEIAILEDALKLEYPDAPHTFTELVKEAEPVMEKLRKDSEIVDLQYGEFAHSLTEGQPK